MATYKIKKGDNLTKIAKQYGTTVDALVKSNNIKDKNLILTGKTLIVPGSKSSSGTPSAVQGRRSAPVKNILQAKPKSNSKTQPGSGMRASESKKTTIGNVAGVGEYKMNIGKSNLTKAQRDAIAANQSSNDKVVSAIVQMAVPGTGAFKVIKGIKAIKAAKAAGAAVKMLPAGKALPKAIGPGPRGLASSASARLARTTTRTSNAVPASAKNVPAVTRAQNNVKKLEAAVKKGIATKGELNEAKLMLRAEVQKIAKKAGK